MQYKEIARRLAEDIREHARPGQRLPGVRELARQEGISLVSARNVYLELQRQGLITIRQGAGTYVAGDRTGGPVDMASLVPPAESLLWMGRHLNLDVSGLGAYDPSPGYEPLREQAGRWLSTLGLDTLPLITAGSQQAIFLAGLALLRPGDTVVVEDPGYAGALRTFEFLGATIRTIPALDDEEALNSLADESVRLVYTMPRAHIPTGRDLSPAHQTRLLELAREYDFYILEDDPLAGLAQGRPLKTRDSEGRVIYVTSLSNLLGPGLRMGLAVFPDGMNEKVIRLKEMNDLSLSGLLQRMLHAVMASGDFGRHVERLGEELERRKAHARREYGWETGGACLWLETAVPGRMHREALLKQGVRITAGDIYGPQWANHVRLSLLAAPRESFEGALATVHARLTGGHAPELTALF